MNFELSQHAQEQMVKRKLPFYLLQMVLENPNQMFTEEGLTIYQSQFNHNGKIQLLRAFVNTNSTPAIVVTIYVTSKITKYWR